MRPKVLQKPLLRPPLVFGVVNITPDSFSDGGLYLDPSLATPRIHELLDFGADVVDIGAESTRPGAHPISPKEEWARLEPIFENLPKKTFPWHRLSVDSRYPETMLKAARYHVGWFNTVGYLPTKDLLVELKNLQPNSKFVVTHMHLDTVHMQKNPLNADLVIGSVSTFFDQCVDEFEDAKWPSENRFFDPGIGFGKDDSANWAIVRHLESLQASYDTIMIGLSRKSLIKRTLDLQDTALIDPISKSFELMLGLSGHVAAIRTHDVKGLVRALTHSRQFTR